MFDISLFFELHFFLLCFGTIIIFIWFIVPYFYLAEHMSQKGYNEDDGAVMLSLIGITNTIGMVSGFFIYLLYLYLFSSSFKRFIDAFMA